MRLGIDFGTTKIVAAVADRGNYPVIGFEDHEGETRDWFPPVIAVNGSGRSYGWQAWAAQGSEPAGVFEPGLVRSIKRTLEDAGPCTPFDLAGTTAPLLEVLSEMALALKTALLTRSTLPRPRNEPLEAMLGVPANSNSNQRFLTVEAFRSAGFTVLGLLNEPSAASIEYGHRLLDTQPSERVAVYDLGGGTFDISLVDIEGRNHYVLASEGISSLGGEDFDAELATLALEAAEVPNDHLTGAERFRLLEECRVRKEDLHANTRRVNVDLGVVRPGWDQVSIPVAAFYERCQPLVRRTIEVTQKLMAEHPDPKRFEALYVTGGGSELPLVSRLLREVFGRKVRRSAYTRSATAIGLAIQAGDQAGYILRDRFARHFGVWREAEGGQRVVFDPLFLKGTPLPGLGEPALLLTRAYHPVHNAGHFRYLEASHLSDQGQPTGDITVWDETRFAFDPSLEAHPDLARITIEPSSSAASQRIEERYRCDSSAGLSVEIRNLTSGYGKLIQLGRWDASKPPPTLAGHRRRTR